MLEMTNVSFRYDKKDLFHKLSLELKSGNIYGLLGKNGAGKTTLLKIMAGLIYCDSGVCRYDKVDVAERSAGYLENMFFLPEEFYLPPVKGRIFVKIRSPLYPAFSHDKFEEYVKEFDIDLGKPLNTLSFGQKKKFLLSFGLATGTSLMIMDEPTNGLDIPSKTKLREIISGAIESHRTFLISTHQVRDVEKLIDPVIIIDGGKIIFNHNMSRISEVLNMSVNKELDGDEIFSQKSPVGYQVVKRSKGISYGNIDLEVLFNSVINDSVTIDNIFNEDTGNEAI